MERIFWKVEIFDSGKVLQGRRKGSVEGRNGSISKRTTTRGNAADQEMKTSNCDGQTLKAKLAGKKAPTHPSGRS